MGIEESGVLLIHSDGPDGSTTFVDSSGQGHSVQARGAVHHEEDAAKFGSTAIHGDGNGDYLRIYSSDDFKFGTGDFTVDFWFNCDSPYWSGLFALDDSTRFLLSAYGNGGDINVYVNSTIYSTAISPTTWYHLAIVRYGNTVTLYLNGSSFATKDVTGVSFNIGNYSWLTVGRHYNDLAALEGYIDEFRAVKGIAEWTSNFTPHTVPYEDGSTDVEVDSPEISLTTSLSSVSQISIDQPEPQPTVQLSTDIGLYINSVEGESIVSSSLGSVHEGNIVVTPEILVALTISSDDGISVDSGSVDNVVSVTSNVLLSILSVEAVVNTSFITDDPAAEVFTGARIQTPEIILSSLISSNIQVDHANFGIHELGVLLIHSDTFDGSTTFVDSSGQDHTILTPEPVHNETHHETDKKKFGATSIHFDGEGDYLEIATSDDWDFGTGDFTIDFWFNAVTVTGDDGLFTLTQNGEDIIWILIFDGILRVKLHKLPFLDIPISENVWYHLAVVRYGDTVTSYLDGVAFGSKDVTGLSFDDDSSGIAIGYYWQPFNPYDGYIDEFRIVKGIAAWTENFTPFSEAYYPWDGTVQSAEISVLISNDSDVQLDIASVESLVTLSHSVDIFTGYLITSDEAIVTSLLSSDLQLGLSQPEIQAVVIHDSDVRLQLLTPESQVVISPPSGDVHIGIPVFTPEILLAVTASSDASLFIDSPEIINTVDVVTNPSILLASVEAIVNTTITAAEVPVVTFTTEHASIYYLLTVTGDGDDTSDIEIPISSFQARLRAFTQNYLSVVIPGLEYSSEISARSHGDLIINVAYKMGEELLIQEELIRVNLEDIRIDPGPRSQSITLSGHKQRIFTESKDVTITEPPIYYNLINGKLRYRFLNPHLDLEVWDYVTVGTDVFRVRTITYSVGALSRQMELSESD